MFTNVSATARFNENHPVTQLITQNQDSRVIVFGFEPGQSVPLHTSSSTVLMQVVEGNGRIQVGDSEQFVVAGDLAICPPNVPYSLSAAETGRFVILTIVAPNP